MFFLRKKGVAIASRVNRPVGGKTACFKILWTRLVFPSRNFFPHL
jgi:hypothetical protein